VLLIYSIRDFGSKDPEV